MDTPQSEPGGPQGVSICRPHLSQDPSFPPPAPSPLDSEDEKAGGFKPHARLAGDPSCSGPASFIRSKLTFPPSFPRRNVGEDTSLREHRFVPLQASGQGDGLMLPYRWRWGEGRVAFADFLGCISTSVQSPAQ